MKNPNDQIKFLNKCHLKYKLKTNLILKALQSIHQFRHLKALIIVNLIIMKIINIEKNFKMKGFFFNF